MAATWTLTIPNWHPTRLNELLSRHWSRRSRLKRADAEIIGVYAKQQSIPLATGRRRVSLTITLGPRQRGGDADAYWKTLLDSLVCCGLLVDDRPAMCELGSVTFRRGEKRGTVIELVDLGSGNQAAGGEESGRAAGKDGEAERCT